MVEPEMVFETEICPDWPKGVKMSTLQSHIEQVHRPRSLPGFIGAFECGGLEFLLQESSDEDVLAEFYEDNWKPGPGVVFRFKGDGWITLLVGDRRER